MTHLLLLYQGDLAPNLQYLQGMPIVAPLDHMQLYRVLIEVYMINLSYLKIQSNKAT